jgi:ribosome-dependent ATPase
MTAVARLVGVTLRYKDVTALDIPRLELPAGVVVGLIGPDGVGKSSLLSLVAGARALQGGGLEVLGGEHARAPFTAAPSARASPTCRRAWAAISTRHSRCSRTSIFSAACSGCHARRTSPPHRRVARGDRSRPFADRPAGKLSGGMKQKLGLCCALIHDPDLLVLDEPTTGVDPLSRRRFWELVNGIRASRAGMSVLVATAYMEEAARFDWLCAMDAGACWPPEHPRNCSRAVVQSLEAAFIDLLPEARRAGHAPVVVRRGPRCDADPIAIEAQDLTMRFGDFTAVDK